MSRTTKTPFLNEISYPALAVSGVLGFFRPWTYKDATGDPFLLVSLSSCFGFLWMCSFRLYQQEQEGVSRLSCFVLSLILSYCRRGYTSFESTASHRRVVCLTLDNQQTLDFLDMCIF